MIKLRTHRHLRILHIHHRRLSTIILLILFLRILSIIV